MRRAILVALVVVVGAAGLYAQGRRGPQWALLGEREVTDKLDRDTIKAGGSSRVIDIDGANRIIRSIDFWYDANTIGRGGKALVRTMGRH